MTNPVTKSAPAEPILLRHDEKGIVTLTLNRPKQYNALSEALLAALQESLDEIAQDDSARVIILAGAGKAFCAGHDFADMVERDLDGMRRLLETCRDLIRTMQGVPQPVVARVHALATAAGCQLVATADLAVASEEAAFAAPDERRRPTGFFKG